MRKIFSIIVCLLVLLPVFSNRIAVTEDGEKVILESDGSWRYELQENTPEAIIITKAKTTLTFFRYQELSEDDNTWFGAEDGMKWVAIDVLIDNRKSNDSLSLNALGSSFKLRDIDGYRYSQPLMATDAIPQMIDPNSEIDEGDFLRGWVVLEIPKNTKVVDLDIQFQDFWGTLKTSWISLRNLIKEH
ncbi:MAG: DUF4352 domain-containing protein [Proteiniphilum sp.]|nr:DUF4352 domain-containing protein [Proteiniphilum sp.]